MSDPQKQNNQQGGGGQQGGGNQQQQQRKPQRNGAATMATCIRLGLWLISAILTVIGVLTFLVTVPPTCRDPSGALTPACMSLVIFSRQGLAIIVGAFVLQIVISVGTGRAMRHPGWARTFRIIEVALNIIGFYWLICLQFGYLPGIPAIINRLDLQTIVGTALIIVLSYFWDDLVDAFQVGPVGGQQQQGGKK